MRRSCLTLFVAAELWGDRSVTEVEEFIAGARRLAQVHMPPCARNTRTAAHAHFTSPLVWEWVSNRLPAGLCASLLLPLLSSNLPTV